MHFEIEDGVLIRCIASGLLKYITVPDGVTMIGKQAFVEGCTHVREIILPDSVTAIEDEAFRNCYALISLSVPETIQHIGKNVLCHCRYIDRNDEASQMQGIITSQTYPEITLHIRRSSKEVFSFTLPRSFDHASGIEDGVLELLLLKRIDVTLLQSQRRLLISRMLESGYLTEEILGENAGLLLVYLVIDGNLDALRFLMESGRILPQIPAALYEAMIQSANQMQKFDIQLLLMDAMRKYIGQDEAADITERFSL